jgi:hypothetical protein
MDASDLQAAYAGLKYVIDSLRTVAGTKAEIAADFRIADVLDKLGKVQDMLFEQRNTIAGLQEENFALKESARSRDAWEARAAKYTLVTTPGGALVYKSAGPPEHYVCTRCFEERKVHFLQNTGMATGWYRCPGCNESFCIEKSRSNW